MVGAKWLDKYRAENLDRFWDLAYGKNILGTLSGHVHSYEKSVNRIAILGTLSTAFPFAPQDDKLICLSPPHIRVVTFDKQVPISRLIEVPLD